MADATRHSRHRRQVWPYGAGLVILALGAGAAVFASGGWRAWQGGDAPSAIVIAPASEPGERLVVQGRVFAPDGVTPAGGVVLYAYHTDESGRYGPLGGLAPRLRGWMRTDAQGRYEYRTIRPGTYPSRSTPAHVHIQLWGAGYESQYGADLMFTDDPLLPQHERDRSRAAGRFAHVCAPERAPGGELLCIHHHRLKPRGDRFEDETLALSAVAPAPAAPAARAEDAPTGRFQVRAADSYVGYRIAKLGVVPVRGRFAQVAGEIVVDPARPERSRVVVRVPLASLESGDPARTETLLSSDFFDARSHPDMRFVSEQVSRGPRGQWLVLGDLTIRGVTRTVTVPAEIQAAGEGKTRVAVFSTRFTIDRRDFGVHGRRWSGGRALLAHEVEIELALAARADG